MLNEEEVKALLYTAHTDDHRMITFLSMIISVCRIEDSQLRRRATVNDGIKGRFEHLCCDRPFPTIHRSTREAKLQLHLEIQASFRTKTFMDD